MCLFWITDEVEPKLTSSQETQGKIRGVSTVLIPPGESVKNPSTLKIRTGSAVHHAAGHVLAVARITLDHHRCGFEDRHSNLCHGKLLMVSLLRRDDWSIGGQHEVNAWVRHQIGLEPWTLHLLMQHVICWLLNTWDMHLLYDSLQIWKHKSKHFIRLGNQNKKLSIWLWEARWCPRSAHHRSLMHFNQSKRRVSKDYVVGKHAVPLKKKQILLRLR